MNCTNFVINNHLNCTTDCIFVKNNNDMRKNLFSNYNFLNDVDDAMRNADNIVPECTNSVEDINFLPYSVNTNNKKWIPRVPV